MPHFPRRAQAMTPESYRRAALRLRRMADGIEAHAEAPARLTGPIQRLLDYAASLHARHHVALAGSRPAEPQMAMLQNDYHPGPRCSCRDCQRQHPDRDPRDVPGQAYCSLCERWVVPTGNGDDLVCPTHTTYVL